MQAQLDKIAQGVMVVDELKAEMRRAIVAERVDWQAERKAFLSDARSSHIREAYARALDHLGKRLELHNLRAANPTPCLADDFIRYMRAISGKDADSTRRVVSACSSFFSFPERRFDEIRNPFRVSGSAGLNLDGGSDPVLRRAGGSPGPGFEPALAAALAVAIEIGLRVGGYPGLRMRDDGTRHTVSKGHRLAAAESLSPAALGALKRARLDPRRPFRAGGLPVGPREGKWRNERQSRGTPCRLAKNATLRAAHGRREALRGVLLARSPSCLR